MQNTRGSKTGVVQSSAPPLPRSAAALSTLDAKCGPKETIVVKVQVPEKPRGFDFASVAPSMAGPIVALFAIYAVHHLTRRRDREKVAIDLHKSIHESLAAIVPVAVQAWEARTKSLRLSSVQDANWKLQQIGGQVERLNGISTRYNWKRKFLFIFFPEKSSVSLARNMAALRDRITEDPFADPDRKPARDQRSAVEQTVGAFILELDQALFNWLD